MKISAVVDRFAAHLLEKGAEIRPINGAPWIEGIEKRLGLSFPHSFRSLIERYSFPLLDIGEAELFANEGGSSEYDLAVALLRDPIMSPWLVKHRLIHIGHPYIGNYDPICLDLLKSKHGDTQVVRLNHEDILLERPTIHRHVLAESFSALMERTHVA